VLISISYKQLVRAAINFSTALLAQLIILIYINSNFNAYIVCADNRHINQMTEGHSLAGYIFG